MRNSERISLYNKVWSISVRQLAKEEGISDVALRKRLVKLGIPLPPRGYWAKSEAKRKAIPIPVLPAVTREVSAYVTGYAINFIDSEQLTDAQLVEDRPFKFITEDSVAVIEDFSRSLKIERQLRDVTPWVRNLINRAEKRREEEEEKRRRYRSYEWYFGREEQVYPFIVSPRNERRVLRILDTLDKRLFEIEGAISESERYYDRNNRLDWRLKLHIPHGMFFLLIHEVDGSLAMTFSEAREGASLLSISDSGVRRIEDGLGESLLGLCLIADARCGSNILAHRQQQRRWEVAEWERSYRKTQEDERMCREALPKLIDAHARSRQFRSFAEDVEREMGGEKDPSNLELLQELRSWVVSLADEEDPFIPKEESRETRDIWALSERVRHCRELRRELEDKRPTYSDEELGGPFRMPSW